MMSLERNIKAELPVFILMLELKNLSLCETHLTMFVKGTSSHGYILEILPKKWRALFLKPRNRCFLLMQSEHIFIQYLQYLVPLKVDSVAVSLTI